ncbi:amidophosphoribosyltransferase, chloroplastic-like [Phalaenopsis equestris]|uniref:amidophosphoribosyltransferase, chloroplastic-like n=1 Tax=Phalaenopsis equestris TaxID=78828 RepID=UPI0009E50426|nr:amidophosphoribosyltransferase, chloroplastic-like [Phalaenopsis equestris]
MAAATTSPAAGHLAFPQNPNPNTARLSFPASLKALSKPFSLRHHHRHLTVSSSTSPNPYISSTVPDLLSDKPRDECGVVGIIGDPDAAYLCSVALHALQHRGQEGAGIVSADSRATLRSVTGLGLVSQVFQDKSKLDYLSGTAAIGHVRYSTAGSASSLANVQPFLAGYRFGQLAIAHNGNLVNYSSLRAQLEDSGSIFNTSSDTEVVLHLIANSSSRPLISRIVDACESIQGAYSLLFLTENKLFAVRDPFGFRPLVLGRLRRPSRGIVFASETCALDLIEADYEREVNPGEIILVDGRDMSLSSLCLMPPKPRKACIFEHIYFALPNSIVFGRAVYSSRYSFGATLAKESPVPNADVVIPVPDSGFYAALGYASHSGIPFQQGLIRSHYVGRTFIQPEQNIRDLAVRLKLAPVRGILEGKSVVVVDDSIVRGTTSSKIVRLIKDAGAREVHMRIASPPIVGSCYYGVDTPRSEELISNKMDVEGVRNAIGCDSLAFLSLESLRSLLGEEAPSFCDACFSGNYPVPPIENEAERLVAVEEE